MPLVPRFPPNMRRGLRLVLAAALACLAPGPGAVVAQDAAAPISPSPRDADFPFQGEFAGAQSSLGSKRSSQRVGLQVVALGAGEFAAVKYLGGLPGAGWRDGQRRVYSGRRLGARVRLFGDPGELEISEERARIRDVDGQLLGELPRIRRVSPTLGAPPPEGATVLFDGRGVEQFRGGQITPDGLLAAGTETIGAWSDFRLHGEFRLPYKPGARGQDRGNSGFYLQSRYEVQVLDSFGLPGEFNDCGALYRQRAPDLNMCFPPGEWQTYDIDFQAARFDDTGRKVAPARISVWHNGVPIHSSVRLTDKTGAGLAEGPAALPLKLQDHGNPVVFRNLWIIDTGLPGARRNDWLRLPLRAEPAPLSVSLSM